MTAPSAPALPADGVCLHYATVVPEWLDYNAHMNVAWYLKAFDDAGEALTRVAGMGADYTLATGNSWVALESHITYQQEARLGDTLRVESRVLELDAKKLLLYQEMYREDTLLATHEQLGVHFNTGSRRTTPFTPAVHARLVALCRAQEHLPRPAWVGRSIALDRGRPRD